MSGNIGMKDASVLIDEKHGGAQPIECLRKCQGLRLGRPHDFGDQYGPAQVRRQERRQRQV
jgi:hypothetical protein